MGNSTLSFSAVLRSSVADSKNNYPDMSKDQELPREERVCHTQTKKALNTIKFSPRADTLKAIFEHARKKS
ncbi:hypothetical protein F0L74_06255 [Chitinophaga agrisoli]|uniref:Uncharacterized protein n=1 Tax=Chitinophaga agrisoli TaxID=2607653 RepID=A0A5B2W2G1_9BACT|nr:hypothetical protein [Chitinophaga agrisoli]KAA2245555.1 hypothetical protein F0L74_06255 [Chitinophaga agrisoli]